MSNEPQYSKVAEVILVGAGELKHDCPKCAEKDAEIEKINGFREKTKAQLRTKSNQVAELLNQRNQLLEQNKDLRAKLDRAREALRAAVKARYITTFDRILVEETLKEIGDK